MALFCGQAIAKVKGYKKLSKIGEEVTLGFDYLEACIDLVTWCQWSVDRGRSKWSEEGGDV